MTRILPIWIPITKPFLFEEFLSLLIPYKPWAEDMETVLRRLNIWDTIDEPLPLVNGCSYQWDEWNILALSEIHLHVNLPSRQPSVSKTGTRTFMAIDALYGEEHSFMHDLESFFWVLFWTCIHYNEPNKESRVVPKFEKWNYEETEETASLSIAKAA